MAKKNSTPKAKAEAAIAEKVAEEVIEEVLGTPKEKEAPLKKGLPRRFIF